MDDRTDALTRREVLRRTALLLGGVAAAPMLAACPRTDTERAMSERTAAAPATATGAPRRPIGVQLYSVRHQMERDVAAMLQTIAGIGYTEVETFSLFGLPAGEFRALLDRNGLVSPSAHVPLNEFRENLEGTLAAAQTLGQQWVLLAWIAESERTRDNYHRLAADFNRFGAAARERGMRFGYHNHEFELEPFEDGRTGLDILLAETDPALVDFELDLYWTTYAGLDALDLLTRHRGRFPLWHVKDMADIQGARRMVSVGEGEIDFERLFARAEELGLRHFYVEHDNPEDPMTFLRTSYEHVSRLVA